MESNNVHIFQTSLYSKNYKKLIKQHRYDVVDKVDEVVEKLSRGEISSQYHNHPLTNLKVNDIHITGDVILLYKWSSNNTILTISLQLIDLTNHNKLKNSEYQKQIKKTIKKLNENKGDKNMEYMEYITTNENTLIVSFKFKNKVTGADTMFNYEVPFEVFIEAVKDYFDKHFNVVLKGKYKDIWNMLIDLGERVNADIIQEFIDDDEIIKELQDRLEEEALKKFDEMCEEEAEDAEDDKLDESYEDDEVTNDEISEALADYQWQITDSTTVGQYAQEIADKLGCSKEQVLKVIHNENPNIREDERMAKVAGLDDEEDEDARYKAIGDEEDLNESYEVDNLEESDLYPILEARRVQEKDLERAASIVYAMYYDENFESGFADDMESKEDLLDFIDSDLDERVEQLRGDEPFAANFDEDDVEWLKDILGLN